MESLREVPVYRQFQKLEIPSNSRMLFYSASAIMFNFNVAPVGFIKHDVLVISSS
jgi:hypothetical protein